VSLSIVGEFISSDAIVRREVAITNVVIAGWTGRDIAAVEKHIAELEELGVARPSQVPIYYRVSATRITSGQTIEVSGENSSGEVEFVLLQHAGRLWVGVGSDHTDRQVETYNVTVSKQMCDKPVAAQFWPFEEVAEHWDRLTLRAYIQESGKRIDYQSGAVSAMRTPANLIEGFTGGGHLTENTLMFCGTLPAKGGIRSSTSFAFEIEDPVLGRKIGHEYDVKVLPVLG
jgi:hypothetical protein